MTHQATDTASAALLVAEIGAELKHWPQSGERFELLKRALAVLASLPAPAAPVAYSATQNDYTREEALAVAEASSLRGLVADAFTDQVEATNLRECLTAIRRPHRNEGHPTSGWLCDVGEDGDDRRCDQCKMIDAALVERFILRPAPAAPEEEKYHREVDVSLKNTAKEGSRDER